MKNYTLNKITLTDKEIENLTIHPYADLVPMSLDHDSVSSFKSSIEANGIINPITLIRDKETNEFKILDGRHRFQIGRQVGAELKFQEFIGSEDDAEQFVLDLNCIRRQMSENQRAMTAAKLVNTIRGNNQHGAVALCSKGRAAERTNSSLDSVKRAVKVKRRGCAELIEAAWYDKISLSRAAEISKESQVRQKEIVEQMLSKNKTHSNSLEKKYAFTVQADERKLLESVISSRRGIGNNMKDADFIKEFALLYCKQLRNNPSEIVDDQTESENTPVSQNIDAEKENYANYTVEDLIALVIRTQSRQSTSA